MNNFIRRPMNRRLFLQSLGIAAGGSALGLAALEGMASAAHKVAAVSPKFDAYYQLAFTDGWVSMPAQASPIPPFFPDVNAPSGFTTYVMGIRDLTALGDNPDQILAEKGKAAISGPLMSAHVGDHVGIDLWNLGLASRPDLTDSHTVHWHGFPNQIAYFDGVPDASLSAPIGQKLTYEYYPQDPGTYMYHCHVEDVEHVHMGLTGMVLVQPKVSVQNDLRAQLLKINPNVWKPNEVKFAYNDPNSYYHREFALFISEINVHFHWNDQHFQDNDWTDYNADFSLFNGRAFPDTVAPPTNPAAAGGDYARLRYNPHSSVVQGNENERILLRMANLGFQEHSILVPGLPLTVIGRDAKSMLAGRPAYDSNERGGSSVTRADISNVTNRIDIGPGESRDVVFDVPLLNRGGKDFLSFPVYDREAGFTTTDPAFVPVERNPGGDGYGGLRTEARLYEKEHLPVQTKPHQQFDLG